jgi:hypothetical protein
LDICPSTGFPVRVLSRHRDHRGALRSQRKQGYPGEPRIESRCALCRIDGRFRHGATVRELGPGEPAERLISSAALRLGVRRISAAGWRVNDIHHQPGPNPDAKNPVSGNRRRDSKSKS